MQAVPLKHACWYHWSVAGGVLQQRLGEVGCGDYHPHIPGRASFVHRRTLVFFAFGPFGFLECGEPVASPPANSWRGPVLQEIFLGGLMPMLGGGVSGGSFIS